MVVFDALSAPSHPHVHAPTSLAAARAVRRLLVAEWGDAKERREVTGLPPRRGNIHRTVFGRLPRAALAEVLRLVG